MEEARQHPTLGFLGWVGLAAYATFMLSALAILISAIVGAGNIIVPVIAPVACVAAVTMSLLAISNALRSGSARWGRKVRFSRFERPQAFWLIVAANAVGVVGYLFVFVMLVRIAP